jgi:hypothetical protein
MNISVQRVITDRSVGKCVVDWRLSIVKIRLLSLRQIYFALFAKRKALGALLRIGLAANTSVSMDDARAELLG